MKAIVKAVNGEEFTISDPQATSIYQYMNPESATGRRTDLPLGWVSAPNMGINFAHVVTVRFEVEGNAN